MRKRDWLEIARKDSKLTMDALAKRLGISESHYCLIENGIRRPSPEVAQKIEAVLSVDWRRFYMDGT